MTHIDYIENLAIGGGSITVNHIHQTMNQTIIEQRERGNQCDSEVDDNSSYSTVPNAVVTHDADGDMPEVPACLCTEAAIEIWQRLRTAGFIVPDGYALAEGVSNNQAAYIADRMAERLGIKPKWKPFQALWGIKNMAQLAGSWGQTGKLPPRTRDIDALFE